MNDTDALQFFQVLRNSRLGQFQLINQVTAHASFPRHQQLEYCYSRRMCKSPSSPDPRYGSAGR
ncbi:hypothetical protein PEC18_04745 [Paucibacter sp. O1-1]|nr:hypothetical protein [Paucibacter sp. O1-1]MDA3825179.1 hypothetical protein [Paucibacter sp. O1-1]